MAFAADGERLIGDAAKNQLTSNPENTVFDTKRLVESEFKTINCCKSKTSFSISEFFLVMWVLCQQDVSNHWTETVKQLESKKICCS